MARSRSGISRPFCPAFQTVQPACRSSPVQRRSAGQPDAGRINAMCRDLSVGSAMTPEQIRSAVDYVVAPQLERESTGLASQIIKLGLDGEVKIIRP